MGFCFSRARVCVCWGGGVLLFLFVCFPLITSTTQVHSKDMITRHNINRDITNAFHTKIGARCSSMVRAFAQGAMSRRIDLSWGGPIELSLVPASAPRLV